MSLVELFFYKSQETLTSLAVASVNKHSSVDILFYCYTLLLPPLNTHDVQYCGTRDLMLV